MDGGMSMDGMDFDGPVDGSGLEGGLAAMVARLGKEEMMRRIAASTYSDRQKSNFLRALEIAADMLAEEDQNLAFSHSGFAMTSLPYRAPKAKEGEAFHPGFREAILWQRRSLDRTLHIASGFDDTGRPIGIPYGSKARLILYYLQTKAKQTNSRFIPFTERSLKAWLEAQGIDSVGGNTYAQTREQARRVSTCTLAFLANTENVEGRRKGSFVRTEINLRSRSSVDGRQGELWQDFVELDEAFFAELMAHAVPLPEGAIRRIADRPMAMDIVVWMVWRLHHVSGSGMEKPISWVALHHQFGFSFKTVRQFKPDFRDNLALAAACLPGARIELDDRGLCLKPGPQLVLPR